jgi:hypothetical protein
MSEGWARCGQCSEIFDAASNLQNEIPASAGDVALDIDVDFATDSGIQSEAERIVAPELPASQPIVAHLSGQAQEAMALKTALQEIVAARTGHRNEAEPNRLPDSAAPVNLAAGSARPTSSEDIDAPEPAISFLQESLPRAHKSLKSVWHKTWVRVALAVVCLALLSGLAVQMTVHERDRLATLFPNLKPILDTACSHLGCTVSTLRQIESVVVETSSFIRVRGDIYRLNLALKNAAPFELAMPALELTLTDAQDQALLRRVLLGSEINPGNKLAPNAEWAGTVELSVRPGSGLDRVAGYRVLAFYP